MTAYQQTALFLPVIWLAMVVVRIRRSSVVLVGGLFVIGLFTLAANAYGKVTQDPLGLGPRISWLPTIGLALAWLGLMIAYSPLADRWASRWFAKPPVLEAFRAVQQSRGGLIAGVVAAWALGGILEEVVAWGIVLKSVEALLTPWLIKPVAAALAVCEGALGAGLMHLYQSPRAVVIITQGSLRDQRVMVMSSEL